MGCVNSISKVKQMPRPTIPYVSTHRQVLTQLTITQRKQKRTQELLQEYLSRAEKKNKQQREALPQNKVGEFYKINVKKISEKYDAQKASGLDYFGSQLIQKCSSICDELLKQKDTSSNKIKIVLAEEILKENLQMLKMFNQKAEKHQQSLTQKESKNQQLANIKSFNKLLKDVSNFMRSKYPRSNPILVPKELKEKFQEFDYTWMLENDMLSKFNVDLRTQDEEQIIFKIKKFINEVIKQMNDTYDKFNELFRAFSKQNMNLKTSRKIDENVESLDVENNLELRIKSTAIVRVLLKWVQGLEEIIKSPEEWLEGKKMIKQFREQQQRETLRNIDEFKMYKKQINSQFHEVRQKYEDFKKDIEEDMLLFNIEAVTLLRRGEPKQKYLPKETAELIKFSSWTSELQTWITIQKLVFLIKNLNIISNKIQKYTQTRLNFVSFNVRDLFRASIENKKKTLEQCYLLFKRKQKNKDINIIKIKNRFADKMTDAVMSFTFKQSRIVCEFQFILANQKDQSNQHAMETINHFFYELYRSPYGAIYELVNILVQRDSKFKYSDNINYSLKQLKGSTSNVQSQEKPDEKTDKKTDKNRPFICSQCIRYYGVYEYSIFYQHSSKKYQYVCSGCILEDSKQQKMAEVLEILYQDLKKKTTRFKQLLGELFKKESIKIFFICDLQGIEKKRGIITFVKLCQCLQCLTQIFHNQENEPLLHFDEKNWGYFTIASVASQAIRFGSFKYNKSYGKVQQCGYRLNDYENGKIQYNEFTFLLFYDPEKQPIRQLVNKKNKFSQKYKPSTSQNNTPQGLDSHNNNPNPSQIKVEPTSTEITKDNEKDETNPTTKQKEEKKNSNGQNEQESKICCIHNNLMNSSQSMTVNSYVMIGSLKVDFEYEIKKKQNQRSIDDLLCQNIVYYNDQNLTLFQNKNSSNLQITELYLNNNQLRSVKEVLKITNLKKLDISNNYIEELQFSNESANLEEIIAYDNKIKEIQGLEYIKNVKSLNFANNQISSFTNQDFQELSYLNLLGNRDIVFLLIDSKKNQKLKQLLLSGKIESNSKFEDVTISFPQLVCFKAQNLQKMTAKNIITFCCKKLETLDLRLNSQRFYFNFSEQMTAEHLKVIIISGRFNHQVESIWTLLKKNLKSVQKISINAGVDTILMDKQKESLVFRKIKTKNVQNMNFLKELWPNKEQKKKKIVCKNLVLSAKINIKYIEKLDLSKIQKLQVEMLQAEHQAHQKQRRDRFIISEAQMHLMDYPRDSSLGQEITQTSPIISFCQNHFWIFSQASNLKQIKIQKIRLRNELHRIFQQRSFKNKFLQLQRLQLVNCDAQQLCIFNLPKLNHFRMTDSEEQKINGVDISGLLQSLLPKLRALQIKNYKIKNLSSIRFAQLQKLNLSQCSIQEFQYFQESQLPKLKFLDLSECRLKNMCKLNFPNLLELDLSNNPLKSISFIGQSDKLVNLKKLIVRQCKITQLHKLTMPNLRQLDLSSNSELVSLKKMDGSDLSKLRILLLMECKIHTLYQFYLPQLKQINLQGNQSLQSLESMQSSQLPQLRIMNLNGCQIKELCKLCLPKLVKLEIENSKSALSLRLQQLKQSQLTSLRYLKLQNSKIKGLISFNLPQLQQLDLNNNSALSQIEELKDANLPRLKILSMDSCKLSKLCKFNLPALQQLNVSRNSSLVSLESMRDADLPKLKEFLVFECDIKHVYPFNSQKLEKIDLAQNKKLDLFSNPKNELDQKLVIFRFKNLTKLVINGCHTVKEIPKLQFKQLELLQINDMPFLLSTESMRGSILPKLKIFVLQAQELRKIYIPSENIKGLRIITPWSYQYYVQDSLIQTQCRRKFIINEQKKVYSAKIKGNCISSGRYYEKGQYYLFLNQKIDKLYYEFQIVDMMLTEQLAKEPEIIPQTVLQLQDQASPVSLSSVHSNRFQNGGKRDTISQNDSQIS